MEFIMFVEVVVLHGMDLQKRFLTKLNLDQFEYTITEIKSGKCTESYYSEGKIVMQNVCDISKLFAYTIKGNYLFAVFSNFACAVFDLDNIDVSVDEFKAELDTIISKNNLSKTNRRR